MRYLIEADVLKLRRRRGLWWSTMLIPAVLVLIVAIVGAIADKPKDVAGGAQFAHDARSATAFVVSILAALIGARLGADEHALGTFRYQVLTGRPRLQLFASKMGALVVIITLTTLAATAIILIGSVLPPSNGGPGIRAVDLGKAFWDTWLPGVAYGLVSLGVGAMMRATGGAIAVSIVLQLAGVSILLALTLISHSLKYVILSSALDRLTENSIHDHDLYQALGGAIVCFAVWVGVFLVLGALRTERSED